MNDKQETAPDKPDERPAPDAQKAERSADDAPAKSPGGLGESTLVPAVSAAVAFAATCLIASTIGGALALLVKIIPAMGGSFIQDAAETGFQTLTRCWLAGMVAVVMTNSFLRGDRRVVIRRSGILGVFSGLLAILILAMSLTILEGNKFAIMMANSMLYIVGAAALLMCLSWRSAEDRPDAEDDEKSADAADEDDAIDRSGS